jgi:hypothetical protein
MLANLKIWTRLSLGFFVVILLLIAVVGLVVHSIAGLKANTEAIGRDRYPKSRLRKNGLSRFSRSRATRTISDPAERTDRRGDC